MSMSSAVVLHTANDCETLLSDSQQPANEEAFATISRAGRRQRNRLECGPGDP